MIKLVSYEPPSLQESVLDIPELVGYARQQLGELEDKSLPDLVHFKGMFCMCVLKKVDISSTDPRDQLIDLSSCPTFDLGVGYPQIKSEPMMFVMLSYSWVFLEHTPLYSLV